MLVTRAAVMLANGQQPSDISVAMQWWQQQGSCSEREKKVHRKKHQPATQCGTVVAAAKKQ